MATKLLFCYAHEDELFLMQLKTHLRPLQRQGLIEVWHDRDISAGSEWAREIDKQLNTANIILLLVSPDFMNSDYCYSVEMKRAMERHERGEAQVIPVILRPVYWHKAPFGKLQALPTDARPIVSSSWHNWDEAFFNVAEGIRKLVEELDVPTSKSIQGRFNLRDTSDEEKLNSTVILTNLRKLYVLSHDNISPGIMAGTEPLPKEWVEEQLKKMGETLDDGTTTQPSQVEIAGTTITLSGDEAALVVYMDAKWRGQKIKLQSGQDLNDYSAEAQVIERSVEDTVVYAAIFPRLPILSHLKPFYENQKSGKYEVHFREFSPRLNKRNLLELQETVTLFVGNVAELDWRGKKY